MANNIVRNLQPSYTAVGGGGVFASYQGPNDGYTYDSPGAVAVYNNREAAPVYAGLTIDPVDGVYEDQGLLAFKPGDTPVATFAAQALSYDFVNQYGTNPAWVYIELNKGVSGDVMYQWIPTSNPLSWHTEDLTSAANWQKWTNVTDGVVTGPKLTLAQVAANESGKTVSRVYLTMGMGDSYHAGPHGTVAWVSNVVIGSTTYSFETVRSAGTYEVDPVSRIEGHLGIKVTTDGTKITNAQAHGNLWRGFENFLLGRDANDAITFVQRICGVCPVPHGMTSTYAVDTVFGYSDGHITFSDHGVSGAMGVPAKAVSIRNLVLGAEFLMSSITHFYHLAAPSYVQGPNIPPWTPYFADSFYVGALRSAGNGALGAGVAPGIDGTDGFSDSVWSVVIKSYVVALRIRRLTFEAGALFAGRMPMTSTLCGGGVTFDGTEDLTNRAQMFEDIIKEVGLFIIQQYVPIALALGVLYKDYDNTYNGGAAIGSGLGRYLAWGAFPNPDSDDIALAAGFKDISATSGSTDSFTVHNKAGIAATFLSSSATRSVPKMLTEDIANSRYEVATAFDAAAYANGAHPHTSATAAYPGDVARTKPKRSSGYTYMKAPRWGGLSCEVGPMARMFVSGLFADGTPLRTSLGAYYTAYVKQVGTTTTGLNPAMIDADIAVCLLRAGLATLDINGVGNGIGYAAAAAWIGTNVAGANLHAKIAAAYSLGAVVISGPIAGWVYGLTAGASTMDRLRARALESLYLVQNILGVYTPNTGTWTASTRGTWALDGWVAQLKSETGGANDTSTSTWKVKSVPTGTVQGWGGTEAPRGALMHQMTINAGKIVKYQCIVPTTWNGSPAIGDQSVKSNHGAIEAACIGAPLDNATRSIAKQDGSGSITTQGGVEVLRCAQSFDPCIACAIH